jgi:hypothetical protein
VVLPLEVLGDAIEPELVPLVLAPDVPVDDPVDEPLDMSEADPLDVPDVVPPVLLDPLGDGLLVDGLRFTSPVDVPVVVLPCALPVDGVQFVELIPVSDVEEVVPADIPDVVLIPLVLPLALPLVLVVVPVPFAPFVLFRPV